MHDRTNPGPPRGSTFAVVGLTLSLLLTGGVGGWLLVAQQRELRALRAEVGELREALAEAGGDRPATGDGPEGFAGLLEGLLGGGSGAGGQGGLGGLLEELLGGEGLEGLDGLDGLPGGLDGDLLSCLAPTAPAPAPAGDAPAAEQVAAIADAVEQLRELEFGTPPPIRFSSGGEFAAEVRALVADGYSAEAADLDRRRLAVLGAIPADTDLRRVRLDLVSGQAAGFYNPETGEVVVRADDPGAPLGPAEQVIVAHELQHAVADQAFGLPVDDDEPDDADAARAALALVEGDATLTMQRFALSAMSLEDQIGMSLDPSVHASRAELAAYPPFLQRELMFAYEDGLSFACALSAEGGWASIDDAYRDLPTTTAQVLYPERFDEAEPAVAPREPGRLSGDWRRASTDTFGAAELLWLLEAPGGDPAAGPDDARGRAAAWAGGTVHLWTRGADSAVGLVLRQRPGEPELCATMTEWHSAAFPQARSATSGDGERVASDGPGQAAVLTCPGQEVRLGFAPDLEDARALVH